MVKNLVYHRCRGKNFLKKNQKRRKEKKMRKSKEEWTEDLIVLLYQEGYIQTLWNAIKEKNCHAGWRLKNKSWAPWFFNMRPAGDSPILFYRICDAMGDLVSHFDLDLLIAVEMAGLTAVGGTSALLASQMNGIRIGYTRPLPLKPRTPIEALEILRMIDAGKLGGERTKLQKPFEKIDAHKSGMIWQDDEFGWLKEAVDILHTLILEDGENYGQKEFVEARFRNGDHVGIFDDMATDIGSKLIARLIVLWQAKRLGIDITCNKIFYLLNRNKGNIEKGLDFANNPEIGLYPEKLGVNYIIEFDDALPLLKSEMKPEEYDAICAYQKDPKQFQDEGVQKEVQALAAKH
jgi:hypothetical protein